MLSRMNFRLTVFISVARNGSFTRAAKELHISQPAVSRHIFELEAEYGVRLLDRTGSGVGLTPAGKLFLNKAEDIIDKYKALKLEMNLMTGNFAGELRVGASSTVSQYILPVFIARFMALYPEVKLSLYSGNTEQIETALKEHLVDIGIIEGEHRKPEFKYRRFRKDELVLVTSVKNDLDEEISLEELSTIPLVLRESGSGTLEVIEKTLASHKLKLARMNLILQLGSTESIKRFILSSISTCAIVSVSSVLEELLDNKLKVIDIDGVEFTREFAYILPQGQHTELQERFMNFMSLQL